MPCHARIHTELHRLVQTEQDMHAINDPHGQNHSPASSDHYSGMNFVLFCEILKSVQTTRAK